MRCPLLLEGQNSPFPSAFPVVLLSPSSARGSQSSVGSAMTRPYGMKGKKRKKAQEKYDREEEDEETQRIEASKRPMTESNSNSHKEEEQEEEKPAVEAEEAPVNEHVGIPIPLSERKIGNSKIIFVLERASSEVAKVGRSYQILNSDGHANFLRKNNMNPPDYWPDIVHQVLIFILDSPLDKAGRVQAVYVRTEKDVLFEVKLHFRLPRTFMRFSGVMLQLLQKLSISAVGKCEKLLRLIKKPVTLYLPVNSRRIGPSYSSQKQVDMNDYVATVPSNTDLVFVVGAMAYGKVETDYTEDFMASIYGMERLVCGL